MIIANICVRLDKFVRSRHGYLLTTSPPAPALATPIPYVPGKGCAAMIRRAMVLVMTAAGAIVHIGFAQTAYAAGAPLTPWYDRPAANGETEKTLWNGGPGDGNHTHGNPGT